MGFRDSALIYSTFRVCDEVLHAVQIGFGGAARTRSGRQDDLVTYKHEYKRAEVHVVYGRPSLHLRRGEDNQRICNFSLPLKLQCGHRPAYDENKMFLVKYYINFEFCICFVINVGCSLLYLYCSQSVI